MDNTQFLQLRDTKSLFPMISTRFSLRSNSDKNGLHLVYLSITHKQKRERLSLDLKIPKNKFDKNKGRIICETQADKYIQLILDNVNAKITNIETHY